MPVSELDVALVEKDGLADALEKAEAQREDLRTAARHAGEQLEAAGRRFGSEHFRAAGVATLRKASEIGRFRG